MKTIILLLTTLLFSCAGTDWDASCFKDCIKNAKKHYCYNQCKVFVY